MTKSSKIVLIGVAPLGVVLVVSFHLLDRFALGIPSFYVWKAVSDVMRDHGRVPVDDAVLY